MEVTQAITIVRDVCFVGALLFGILKLGLWLKPALDFFIDAKIFMSEVRRHMATTEANMTMLLTNHLPHLEIEVQKLSEKISQVPQKEKTISIKVE